MAFSGLSDAKYAIRSLARRPLFTAVILLTLGLGIGSNVAIFSVANAVLFRSLPFRDPEELAFIWNRLPATNVARDLSLSMADELIGGASRWRFETAAAGLARLPLLVLTSDDGLAAHTDPLVRRVRALGNTRVTKVHQPTDHSWSDKRIALQVAVLTWLARR